jgi:methylated-DNA-protein-cysteine methyltransferase-like protein
MRAGEALVEDREQREFRERVWLLLHRIPPGRVCSYGQLAALADRPEQARLVGRILAALPADSRLPWHRVVSASGRITSPAATEQRQRLEREGGWVWDGRIDLRNHRWPTS